MTPMLKFLLLITLTMTPAGAGDWPQFLGPDRTGVSPETDLLSEFPAAGPNVAWRTSLGVGMSNLSIVDGVVYTLYQDDRQQYLVALSASDGEQKWKSPLAPAYENAMGNGPRATPTVAGGIVCVYTGDGVLAAIDSRSGDIKWRVDVPGSLAGKPADYGFASSPLIADETVVVHAGSPNGSVAGYDIATGNRKWSTGASPAGYSSPVMLDMSGTSQVVSFVGDAVLGVALDGRQLWRHPFVTDYGCNTACPVQISEDSILISSGENHGAAILKISGRDGQWEVTEAWTSFGAGSILRAEWQTPVLHDGHLYGLDNKGSAGPITNLVCINLKNNERTWSQDRFGKSNFTLADGKLFISTMRGELVIAKASPDEFTETARAVVLNGATRQAPAISGGKLYMRDDREVVCIDLRPAAASE